MLRPVAERLPYFGVVVHRGRTTGRQYRTPVNAFPNRDGYLIALTYGRETDWVKNVLAAGRCRLIHRGMVLDLAAPAVLPLSEHGRAIPAWIRAVLRTMGVDEILRLTVAPPRFP